MKNYYFKTTEFGVTDNGIHLLRSGFNYETIAFNQISKMEISRGMELHNWFVIFFIGLVLLTPGLYVAIDVVNVFLRGEVNSPYGARLALLLFIPLVGIYFIYTSLQTGTILKIKYGSGKNDKFPLRQIVKEKRMSDFKVLMKEKLSTKFRTM